MPGVDMGLQPWEQSESQWFVLVTGANGGLGLSICERTITEHFTNASRSPTQHLVLIVSTRAFLKTRETIGRLRLFLHKFAESSAYAKQQRTRAKQNGKKYRWQDVSARVHFLGVELDLCDLRQIYNAAAKIRGEHEGLSSPDLLDRNGIEMQDGKGRGLKDIKIPRLDALVMNAGMIGVDRIRWGAAIWGVLSDTQQCLTWWDHNIMHVGKTIRTQGALAGWEEDEDGMDVVSQKAEPPLGEVFCANVFGHYILAHELMPLLNSSEATGRAATDRGRIIWVSSIEALDDSFSINDFQGLKSHDAYRSSKRLADILALTAELPAVRKIAAPWYSTRADGKPDEKDGQKPALYVTHPGICATGIVPLPAIMQLGMLAAFYFARVLGSIWHTITSIKGAVAPTWLVLADQQMLDSMEGEGKHGGGKGKWGSSTNLSGEERVRRTWVPGWGLGGVVGVEGDEKLKGRKRGTVELTKEAREDFELLGAKVWAGMEELRLQWEKILGDGGFGWDD